MKNNSARKFRPFLPLLAAGLLLFPGARAHSARAQPRFDSPVRVCRVLELDQDASLVTASDNAILSYLSRSARNLNALSIGEFRNLWAVEPGGQILGSPRQIGSDTIDILTETPDAFVARSFSITSGLARQSHSYSKTEFREASFLTDSLLLRTVSNDLVRISPGDSKAVWEIRGIDANLGGMVVGAEHFALGQAVYETRSGNLVLKFDQQLVSAVLGFRGDSEIFVAGSRGELYVYDLRKQTLRWRFKTGGKITSAVASGNSVLIGSTDNYLYKLSLRNGSLEWKTRLFDRVLDRPVVAGGIFLIANQLKNSVGIHDLRDGRLINRFDVPGDSLIIAVRSSPTGAIVFTSDSVYEVASQCPK